MATLSQTITPSNILTDSNTATLTNKTINVDNNTILGLPSVPADIRKPEITSPANNAIDIVPEPTINGNAYAPVYSVDSRDYRQLQIDLAAGDFSTPEVDQQANSDNITVSTPLTINTAYKARIRDVSTTGAESDWSDVVSFTTANIFVNEPTLTVEGSPDDVPETPTLTTSAFATTPTDQDTHLNTDWQVLDDVGAVVYESLADTVNKTSIVVPAGNLDPDTTYTFRARHRGTTYGASSYGTVIATTVAEFAPPIGSAFGGGFYAGRINEGGNAYDLVIAPKSSGQSSSTLAYRTANTASPAATQTLNNGPAATAALVADGNSSEYPAAHFCNNLTIGGFSDWYLPARDELELCYRNLKPSTTANSTSNRAQSAYTYPEGDDISADTMGVNRNSAPTGAAYTSGNPAQTSVSAFQTEGTEAFASAIYWSSSEFSATDAWRQSFNNGSQSNNEKFDVRYNVRAVRRVAV